MLYAERGYATGLTENAGRENDGLICRTWKWRTKNDRL